ncbi:hypothetical protein ACFL2D_00210 [Patescibacteria group bacterium]
MAPKRRFSSYTYSEGRTGEGQLVEFTCAPVDAEKVKEFLENNIRSIDIPTTGRVNLPHGSYGRYTRYDIEQHKYAGGGGPGNGGYIEVLEIKNPPDERVGIVLHEHNSSYGTFFTEWESLKQAKAAFEKTFSRSSPDSHELPGFIRRVNCGRMTPWYYAVGVQQLIGDYAFPEDLHDDPVYVFGKKFVVTDKEGSASLKMCMGTRFYTTRTPYSAGENHYRLVHWDDGTVWQVGDTQVTVRPAEEQEEWISAAVNQFRELLSGQRDNITVDFTDGSKFFGSIKLPTGKKGCAAGDYLLEIRVEGEEKPMEGWVNDFSPTQDEPDVICFVRNRLEKQGKKILSMEIKRSRKTKNGKKWKGVFFAPPK